MSIISILKWIQKWYLNNCDGDWEHFYENIRIMTIDNPGWMVKVNLIETNLENVSFDKIKFDRDELNWVSCYIKEGTFIGAGGPMNLEEILKIFRDWAISIEEQE